MLVFHRPLIHAQRGISGTTVLGFYLSLVRFDFGSPTLTDLAHLINDYVYIFLSGMYAAWVVCKNSYG